MAHQGTQFMLREIMESEELQNKLQRLPPHMQTKFLKYLEELSSQESTSMIQFIEESRRALRLTASEIRSEQEALQLTTRKLAESRASDSADVRGSKSRQGHRSARGRHGESLSAELARQRRGGPSPEPLRMPDHPRPPVRLPPLKDSEQADPKRPVDPWAGAQMYPQGDASDSAESDVSFEFAEETKEVMQGMRAVSAKVENERERQAKIMQERKEKKRAKREQRAEQAHELLREASCLEERALKDKERQGEKLKARLEERKRRKDKPHDLHGDIEAAIEGAPGSHSPEIETLNEQEGKAKSKEKKKKKKDKEKERESGDKEKKKKKKKDKEQEKIAELSPL